MANCPNCNKPVPWYKSITHTRWNGVKCKHCGTRSFIKQSDLIIWSLISALSGLLLAIIIFFVFHNFIISLFIVIIFSFLFYNVFGWNRTTLEIRNKKEDKWLVFIKMFGVLFIILGILQFKYPVAFFMLYKSEKPVTSYVSEGGLKRVNEAENLIEGKSKNYSKEKRAMLNKELSIIRKEILDYKAKYVDKKSLPLPTKLLIIFSLISAGLFIYTGILILKLSPSFKPYLFSSIVFGLFTILILGWEIFYTVSFVFHLTDKFSILLSKINQTPAPIIHSNLSTLKSFFLQPIVAAVAITQPLFVVIIIIFFNLPRVKEQFK